MGKKLGEAEKDNRRLAKLGAVQSISCLSVLWVYLKWVISKLTSEVKLCQVYIEIKDLFHIN